MKSIRILTAVALALGLCSAAAAGDGKKCYMKTQDCLDSMAVKLKASGWMGVELEWDDAKGGQVLKTVIPGSPAEAAGLKAGDVLKALNGVRFAPENDEAIKKARKEWRPGQTVSYTVRRGGNDKEISLTLGEWPADVLARYIGQHMLEHVTQDMASAKQPG